MGLQSCGFAWAMKEGEFMKAVSKVLAVACALAIAIVMAGCASQAASSSASGSSESAAASSEASASASEASKNVSSSADQGLAPGEYSATFTTDSSMFHVNEANGDKGVLTVADDGTMTIHVSLAGKGILNLYAGLAADAENDPDNLLQPTTDTVTYEDGTTEEVNGFDIPVPALDEEFDVALIGTKGKWYDHKVSVSDPVALEETAEK